MVKDHFASVLPLLAFAFLLTSMTVVGQRRSAETSATRVVEPRKDAKLPLPNAVDRQVTALGVRMRDSEKERVVLAGLFIDEQGRTSPATATLQLPGLVRLEGFRPGNLVVAFDGETPASRYTREDQLLIETFVMDTSEGMFDSLSGGAAVQLLGRDYGPDPKLVQNYKGPRYDIYEVTAELRPPGGNEYRSKLYYFDSRTHLLASTVYSVGGVRMESRFSQWQTVDGVSYPGRIDHLEDGRTLFSVVISGMTAGRKADVATFR